MRPGKFDNIVIILYNNFVTNLVQDMIPKMLKISEFRKNLTKHLNEAKQFPLVIQDAKNAQYVLVNLVDYNRLSALEELYKEEDPEGAYKETFIQEMRGIIKDQNNIDPQINSLKDI